LAELLAVLPRPSAARRAVAFGFHVCEIARDHAIFGLGLLLLRQFRRGGRFCRGLFRGCLLRIGHRRCRRQLRHEPSQTRHHEGSTEYRADRLHRFPSSS
jgi:hypothetical protein